MTEEGIKILLAVRRNKDNDDGKEETIQVVERDFLVDLEYLKARAKASQPGFWRVYRSINRRDFKKAQKLLIHKLIDTPDIYAHRIDSLWKTCLLQPECRLDKNWLLDIDRLETDMLTDFYERIHKFKDVLEGCGINIIKSYITKGGVHFIVEPFDTRLIETNPKDWKMEIHKDGLEWIETFLV